MPLEKSAGLIVFRKENDEINYLLLHYESGHWGFPKGHIEEGETLEQAAVRETEEETGIDEVDIKENFKEWIKYFFRKDDQKIFKIVTYLLGEAGQEEITISHEHTGFKWLSFEDALNQLTFDNTKLILKKANQFLKGEELNSK